MPIEPKKSQSIVFIVALFIILLIVAFAMTSLSKKPASEGTPATTETPTTKTTKTEVKVDKVDLTTAQGDARLPQGFPTDIPVETTGAFESYTADYPTRNFTQYTVSYTTTKTIKDTYALYLSYMTKAGYTFRSDGKDEKHGFLYGTKDNNDLSVVVSAKGSETSVQMSYLKKR